MDVWKSLPIRERGPVDIWARLAQDLQAPATLADGPGIWGEVVLFPGGLWRELQDETLILGRGRVGVWQAAGRETLLLKRSRQNIWHLVNRQVAEEGETDLWQQAADETLILDRPQTTVWSKADQAHFAREKPARAPGWALKQLPSAQGSDYYVLKHIEQGTYLKLTEQQTFLWKLMDGNHTVQDLAVANFTHYQTLDVDFLLDFLGQLQAKGFLVQEHVDVYRETGQALWRRSPTYWMEWLARRLFQSEWSFQAADRFFGRLYRGGGKLLFTRPLQGLFLLMVIAGLPAFAWLTLRGDFSLLRGSGESLGLGLVGLALAQLAAVFLHECAHALATKHYGREVRRAGIGLYFGMPAFYVDTTDIWMEPRRPRLAVTWAGPYSGFLLGALTSLALLVVPDGPWAGLAFQFATFCYLISFVNLNPLLKLDGYYLLMDWLEMPRLRERSISFVRESLWGKLRRREPFNRDEKIYAVFGLLAMAWTLVALFSLVQFYGGAIFGFVERFLGAMVAWAILGIVALLVAARLVRRLWRGSPNGEGE